MHELAICQALVDQVAAIAARHDAAVQDVIVQLGPLSGVEPMLLMQAYPLACAGSAAAGSRLVIQSSQVRVACRLCGAETPALPNRLLCGACGTWQTDLVGGDEMLLLRVTLESYQTTANDDQPSEACHV
jgi:hydrogenase nickel incorporation protein HypA/HybF